MYSCIGIDFRLYRQRIKYIYTKQSGDLQELYSRIYRNSWSISPKSFPKSSICNSIIWIYVLFNSTFPVLNLKSNPSHFIKKLQKNYEIIWKNSSLNTWINNIEIRIRKYLQNNKNVCENLNEIWHHKVWITTIKSNGTNFWKQRINCDCMFDGLTRKFAEKVHSLE